MTRRVLTLLVLVSGCAHKAPPPSPPPAAPVGDTVLRWKAQPGESLSAKGKLTIVQDVSGGQGPKASTKHLALAFDFTEEEKVESVNADGTATVHARLVDVVGQTGEGGNQAAVDQFALALDDVKITFQRSARGEVNGLILAGIHPPLEEQTARAMLNSLYSAQRGPLFPEQPQIVGGTWKAETALPPSTGFSGQITYSYTLSRKGGGVAVIAAEGKVDGAGGSAQAPRAMKGRSTGEYRFDLESGKLIGTVTEGQVDVDQVIGTPPTALKVKQQVRAEWALQAPPEKS
jgi:hypothetical protein